jgi:hypothetical protein
MPITAQAAREVAALIIAAYCDAPDDVEISLAASLIVKAVERDELSEQ